MPVRTASPHALILPRTLILILSRPPPASPPPLILSAAKDPMKRTEAHTEIKTPQSRKGGVTAPLQGEPRIRPYPEHSQSPLLGEGVGGGDFSIPHKILLDFLHIL